MKVSQTVTLAAVTLLAATGNAVGTNRSCLSTLSPGSGSGLGSGWSGSGLDIGSGWFGSAFTISANGTNSTQRFSRHCTSKVAYAVVMGDWWQGGDLCRACFEGVTEEDARRNDCASIELPGDSLYNWFKTCDHVFNTTVSSGCPAEWKTSGDCGSHVGLECEYGQQCCCGECIPLKVSLCSESGWIGITLDDGCTSTCDDDGGDNASEIPSVTSEDHTKMCPSEFPVCDSVGDCIKAICASGDCWWSNGGNYIRGPQNDGADCERSYLDDTKHECPAYLYLTDRLDTPCYEVGMECGYGEECCCGECHPIAKAVCSEDDLWNPTYIEACVDVTECGNWPAYWPPYTANLTWPFGNISMLALTAADETNTPSPTWLGWANDTTWPAWGNSTNSTWLAWANDTWSSWPSWGSTTTNSTWPAWGNTTDSTWPASLNTTGPAWTNDTTWQAWNTTNATQPTVNGSA